MTMQRAMLLPLAAILALILGQAAAQDVTLAELAQATHFHGLAFDPSDPARFYIATHNGLFLGNTNGTATVVSATQDDFMGFTPNPADPTILYASGHPAGGGNLGVIVSGDGGKSWQQLSPGGDEPVDFHAMAASRADPRVLYGSFKGIRVSRDGGKTWSRAGEAPEQLIALAASALGVDVVYAATATGLMASYDAAARWVPIGPFTEAVSALAASGGTLYAYVLGQGLLSAAEAAPGAWTPLSADRGEDYLLLLAVDPKNEQRLLAATPQNRILLSEDGGRNWRPVGEQ